MCIFMIIRLEKTKIKNKWTLIVKLKETRNFSKYIVLCANK